MNSIDKIATLIGLVIVAGGAAIVVHSLKNRDPMELVSGCAVGGLGIRYALKNIRNENYQEEYRDKK